jgi:glycosyltransferase involved in cell wall biosynthesis
VKTVSKEHPIAVSAIIPLYNQERFIAATLDSALAQDYPGLEILLVDDGSTDGGGAIAECYAARHPDRIRLLQHPEGINRGVSATRNLAISEARGDWVAFLDADDLWHPEKLIRQMSFLATCPEAGVCYTLANVIREGRGEAFIPEEEIVGTTSLPPLAGDRFLQIVLVQVNFIFSSIMVRTDLLRDIGGFDEKLPFQSEDRVMVAQVAARGEIACLPEVLCSYRAHDASYTSGVIAARIWPAIFYDVQVRVMISLFRDGLKKQWAHNIARYVLPVSFVRAAACSLTPSVFGQVIRDFAWSLCYAPWIPVFMGIKLAGFIFKGHVFTRSAGYIRRTALFKSIAKKT